MEPINKDLSSNIVSLNNGSSNKENDFNDKSNKLKIKDKNKNFIKRKVKKSSSNIKKIKYPGITHFNTDSHFVYDLSNIKDFILSTNDKNTMKLNQLEVQFIKNEINMITNNVEILNNENYVDIPLDELNSINDYFSIDTEQNSIVNWVNGYINKEEEREKISIEKIRKLYNDKNGESINKTKMYNIFKQKID
jgi:hypothetical protein